MHPLQHALDQAQERLATLELGIRQMGLSVDEVLEAGETDTDLQAWMDTD